MKEFKNRIDVEYDVSRLEESARDEYDLHYDWYGDTYGSLIECVGGVNLMNKAQFAEDQEAYDAILKEIENNFISAAQNVAQEESEEQ